MFDLHQQGSTKTWNHTKALYPRRFSGEDAED